jgi:hypothetical protein
MVTGVEEEDRFREALLLVNVAMLLEGQGTCGQHLTS